MTGMEVSPSLSLFTTSFTIEDAIIGYRRACIDGNKSRVVSCLVNNFGIGLMALTNLGHTCKFGKIYLYMIISTTVLVRSFC